MRHEAVATAPNRRGHRLRPGRVLDSRWGSGRPAGLPGGFGVPVGVVYTRCLCVRARLGMQTLAATSFRVEKNQFYWTFANGAARRDGFRILAAEPYLTYCWCYVGRTTEDGWFAMQGANATEFDPSGMYALALHWSSTQFRAALIFMLGCAGMLKDDTRARHRYAAFLCCGMHVRRAVA